MEAPGPAIEQYFNQLISMRLLSQVVVSDKQGNTVLACFGQPSQSPADAANYSRNLFTTSSGRGGAEDEEDMTMESNVVLSGARNYQLMDQLRLGSPKYISAQYRDAMVVQTMDKSALLTLIGHRSQGHFIGGLLALLPQIRATSVYAEMIKKVDECFQ